MLLRLECPGPPSIYHRNTKGCVNHGQIQACLAHTYGSCSLEDLPSSSFSPLSSPPLPFSPSQDYYYDAAMQKELSFCGHYLKWKVPNTFLKVFDTQRTEASNMLSFIYLLFACWPHCYVEPGAYLHQGLSAPLQH